MRGLAGFGTFLVVINGLLALGLNVRNWRRPSAAREEEPKGQRRARKTVTWVFVVLVGLIILAIAIAIVTSVVELLLR